MFLSNLIASSVSFQGIYSIFNGQIEDGDVIETYYNGELVSKSDCTVGNEGYCCDSNDFPCDDGEYRLMFDTADEMGSPVYFKLVSANHGTLAPIKGPDACDYVSCGTIEYNPHFFWDIDNTQLVGYEIHVDLDTDSDHCTGPMGQINDFVLFDMIHTCPATGILEINCGGLNCSGTTTVFINYQCGTSSVSCGAYSLCPNIYTDEVELNCIFNSEENIIHGCTDPGSLNYDETANINTGCLYLGDVNGDLTVDIADVVTLVAYVVQNEANYNLETIQTTGEINNDGIINVIDVVLLVNIIVNQ
tara:strand:- start:43 stop:954 length:912 start_codon:yes stop_codon:yes gene_type:complete